MIGGRVLARDELAILNHVRLEEPFRHNPGAGDFERSHRTVDGVDLGVVVKRGDLSQATFVLDAAADILHYYNVYFDTPYPLPKLDLIAGPGSSVTFGAMENWGAIFSWESEMLVVSGYIKISSEIGRRVANVADAVVLPDRVVIAIAVGLDCVAVE